MLAFVRGPHPDKAPRPAARAFLPAATLRAAYDEALHEGYLWHEVGDVCLIAHGGPAAALSPRPSRRAGG